MTYKNYKGEQPQNMALWTPADSLDGICFHKADKACQAKEQGLSGQRSELVGQDLSRRDLQIRRDTCALHETTAWGWAAIGFLLLVKPLMYGAPGGN